MMALISTGFACGHDTINLLDPKDFLKLIETQPAVSLIDVRTPQEFEEGRIPGAVNIDESSSNFIEEVKQEINPGSAVAIYCRSGRRSEIAAKLLAKAGYEVSDLKGGILNWEKSGLTVTNGKEDFYLTPEGEKVEIQGLIHASIRIVFNGKEIEIDPVGKLGDRITDYSLFPKAGIILVTHEHHDHLDPDAIKTLSKSDTIVIANPNSAKILGYGKVMKNGDSLRIDDKISIEAVPAYNISPDRLQFHPKGRDNGYVLNLGGLKIYIAGDTENIPEMKDLKDIDIAFLPCNLPYTMTPDQLVEAAKEIMPKVLYPYHYGSTDLSSITPELAPLGIEVRILPFD